MGDEASSCKVISLDGTRIIAWNSRGLRLRQVVVANRDPERACPALQQLIRAASHGNTAEALQVDSASLEFVRTFAADLVTRTNNGSLPPFGAVVYNAGVQVGATMTHTIDVYGSSLGVDHLAHSPSSKT